MCPAADTKCPAVATQCPAVATQCPAVDTQCPAVATKCPPVSGGTDTGEMPVYQPGAAVTGTLRTKGSDLLPDVMDRWAKAFVKHQPQVTFDIQSKGSATAVPALIEKTADAGPMSRPITPEEAADFQKAYDVPPTTIAVGVDCEGVFVNKGNPVKGLTLLQLDGIFSKDLRSGHPAVAKWGEVGVADADWANQAAKPYVKPGAPALFRELVLLGGEVKEVAADPGPGTAGTAGRPPTALAADNDPEAIQFAPLAYKSTAARLVSVSEDGTGPYVEASFANALAGKYPLGAVLTINVVKKPGEPLPPVLREFLLFVLSREGQEIAAKAGFGSLPSAIVVAERKKLD
jgi:phosphate transport system substrate-binding protein